MYLDPDSDSRCVTLGKFLTLSVPQLSYLQNAEGHSVRLLGALKLKKINAHRVLQTLHTVETKKLWLLAAFHLCLRSCCCFHSRSCVLHISGHFCFGLRVMTRVAKCSAQSEHSRSSRSVRSGARTLLSVKYSLALEEPGGAQTSNL